MIAYTLEQEQSYYVNYRCINDYSLNVDRVGLVAFCSGKTKIVYFIFPYAYPEISDIIFKILARKTLFCVNKIRMESMLGSINPGLKFVEVASGLPRRHPRAGNPMGLVLKSCANVLHCAATYYDLFLNQLHTEDNSFYHVAAEVFFLSKCSPNS